MKVHYKQDTLEIWGYYPEDYENIPTPNMSISEEVWQEAVKTQATHINLETKELYKKEVEATLEEMKEEPPSIEEIMITLEYEFKTTVQNILDTKAKERGYDNIVSAVSYAGYENPFRAQAEAYGKWRANVWSWGYALLGKIQSGEIDITTLSMNEVLKDMPKLELSDEQGTK